MATQKIEWSFNPPLAPHHGVVFEAMVKLAKRALSGVLAGAACTDEELQTAFSIAEGQLNTRPLTVVSPDAEDLEPLTPMHFLTGSAGINSSLDCEEGRFRNRWRTIQQLSTEVWKRWMHEMVPQSTFANDGTNTTEVFVLEMLS